MTLATTRLSTARRPEFDALTNSAILWVVGTSEMLQIYCRSVINRIDRYLYRRRRCRDFNVPVHCCTTDQIGRLNDNWLVFHWVSENLQQTGSTSATRHYCKELCWAYWIITAPQLHYIASKHYKHLCCRWCYIIPLGSSSMSYLSAYDAFDTTIIGSHSPVVSYPME